MCLVEYSTLLLDRLNGFDLDLDYLLTKMFTYIHKKYENTYIIYKKFNV